MSDHFVVTGGYTGDEYLVTVDTVAGRYLLTVYHPAHWRRSASGGLSYSPGWGHQCRGEWLRRQDHLARAHVRGVERARRREDRRHARTARLVERRNR